LLFFCFFPLFGQNNSTPVGGQPTAKTCESCGARNTLRNSAYLNRENYFYIILALLVLPAYSGYMSPRRPSIGTAEEYRREAKEYLDRAKNLRRIAKRDESFTISLTNVAICLEDTAKYLSYVCAELESPRRKALTNLYTIVK
jgi:hypothetical protein